MVVFGLVLFWFSAVIISFSMFGYPVFIKCLGNLFLNRKNGKDYSNLPTVTVMIVAHNEESVILKKLENVIRLDYPREKIEFLVSSDNSYDDTNVIVKNFIKENQEYNIRIYEVKERKGKTNAQNEAQKMVKTEFLVMTDANAILDKNAIRELMASFVSDDISYVTGRLIYINKESTGTSELENTYWDMDTSIRDIESRIQTITAGNGALYACRNSEYYDFEPIECHDLSMPLYYALRGKRAIANNEAIAYEKAGECNGDEFARKVRMNREILKDILPDIRILNIFKYKWFSFFYLGHRTSRYLLWISHLIIFVTSILLFKKSLIYKLVFIFQVVFYLLATLKLVFNIKNKWIMLINYYVMTVVAQWCGVYNILTGKAKPFWEKAESTR